MLQILNRATTVACVKKSSALVAAEARLNDARERRETLRAEAALIRGQYMAKPAAALDRLIREYDAKLAEAQAAIVAARNDRADLLTAYQAEAASQLAAPIAEAAEALLSAASDARAAYRIIAEAAQISGHEGLRTHLGPVDALALDRLVALADGLTKLDVIARGA